MQKIEVDLFTKFKFISQMKANPSKNMLAFLSAKADEEKNKYVYDLYKIENYKMAKLIQLKDNSSFIWEDDSTILFPYAKNTVEEKQRKEFYTIYYRYNLDTKVVSKAFEFQFPTNLIKRIKNTLILSSNLSKQDEVLIDCDEKTRKQYLKDRKINLLYEDIDQVPFYFNGQGFVQGKQSSIYLYDIESKEVKKITDETLKVGQVLISKNQRYIYYTATPKSQLQVLYTNVYRYDLIEEKTEVIYDKKVYDIAFIEFIGDQLICAATDQKLFGLNQNNDFYVIKNQDLELFAKFGQAIGNTIGSDVRLGGQSQTISESHRLIFIATIDDHAEIMSLSSDGNIETIFKANGSVEGLTMVEEKIYFVGQLKQRLQEIYAFNHGRDQQLTRLNYRTLKDYYVAKPKKIVLKKPTHEVTGFVLLPIDFDKEKSYKAILDIHGGPKTVYGSTYYHEMQYWASLGYIVMYCNPRGSDGKGDEFADIRGKYGTIDYEDIMNFVDAVIKQVPQIDEKQLYVTGGSYGGFMTNWIVGHTNRFKAAVTQRSISNWVSFFGTSDIGFYFAKDQTAANPLDDVSLMWEQSPLKYADQVQTPTLFIHSDEDYRCPIEQAMQFYSVLKYKGVDTKLVWFKGETHELSRSGKPHARTKRLNDITNWFENH
ncbi:MAG: alpha/beta hydrolase family protein [Acholeplasmataceae bacterium]